MTVTAPTSDPFDWLHDDPSGPPQVAGDPDFATWLRTEYVPIAGGWQY